MRGEHAGERCLQPSTTKLVHGRLRYCSKCLKQRRVKELLQSEIHDNCATPACKMKVLKRQDGSEQTDRYCEHCLQSEDVKAELEWQKCSEDNYCDNDDDSSFSPAVFDQATVQHCVSRMDKYTRQNLEALRDSAHVKDLPTKLLGQFMSFHLRYLVDVFLLGMPAEMANVLVWISRVTHQNWNLNDRVVFEGRLFKFKSRVLDSLIATLQSIQLSGTRFIAKRDALCTELAAQKRHLSAETISMFAFEIDQQQSETVLDQFVQQRVHHQQGESMTSTELFEAFCSWWSTCKKKDRCPYANSVSFGKALAKCRSVSWTIRERHHKKIHCNITCRTED